MMKPMMAENGVTFKDLEKNIYSWVCGIGRRFTSEFQERYDRMLMEERDKSRYRHKGSRKTTIKTVYGEISYRRSVYEAVREDGTRHYVYLLDETLELENVGLISTNMAELLVKGITEYSYRECASEVSRMTGQTISAMGVWNVIQSLGKKPAKKKNSLWKNTKRETSTEKKRSPCCLRRRTACM